MAFIKTIDESDASGKVKEMYEKEIASNGYLPNFAKLFCHRPEVMLSFRNLMKSINGNMDKRRYELVTIAAAKALHSSYCMLAHGTVLLDHFYDSNQLNDIVKNPHSSVLTTAEIAMMEFAEKIVRDAASVNQEDVNNLYREGFRDDEIFEITTVAAIRCFFSKTLDALGAEPDKKYLNLDEKLRDNLVVGRQIPLR